MTNLTDERLAVEVCGAVRTSAEAGRATYFFPDNTGIYCDDWRPWRDLNQAWMVVEAIKKNYDASPLDWKNAGPHLAIERLFHDTAIENYSMPELAHAIFDAACQAIEIDDDPDWTPEIGRARMEAAMRMAFEGEQ